jgi:hypothetical protein
MKQRHTAVSSTSRSSVNEGISADLPQGSGDIADADVEQMIRTLAYLRAEERGFLPGRELDDWLAAEQEWFHDTKRT